MTIAHSYCTLSKLHLRYQTDGIIKKQKKTKKKQKKNKKKTVTEPFKIKLPAARASKGKKKFSMSIDANNFRRKHIFYVIMSFSSSKFIFKITT